MVCENCPYKLNLGNDLGDLGFKCGLDYCIHECALFDCTVEELVEYYKKQENKGEQNE